MEKSDSIIIIPTYNEKENIENIIRAVFGLEKFFHILIIEDSSPDGTAAIVRRLQQEFPDRLFMIERKGKLGLGTAYITGFKWAREKGYDYVFEMDADFSHNPNDLPRLYDKCAREGYDVAIGSRLDGIRFKGYAFQIEMKFTAYKCGFKIAEVPVIFVNRELGTSKMNSSIFGEAIMGVIQLKWYSWFHKYPQKKNL